MSYAKSQILGVQLKIIITWEYLSPPYLIIGAINFNVQGQQLFRAPPHLALQVSPTIHQTFNVQEALIYEFKHMMLDQYFHMNVDPSGHESPLQNSGGCGVVVLVLLQYSSLVHKGTPGPTFAFAMASG